jgi:hypothetical protein
MAERPDEQTLFRRQIGGNGLVDVEAVDEERPIFVCPGRQRSRQQTGESAKCAPRFNSAARAAATLTTRGAASLLGAFKGQIHRAPDAMRDRSRRQQGNDIRERWSYWCGWASEISIGFR